MADFYIQQTIDAVSGALLDRTINFKVEGGGGGGGSTSSRTLWVDPDNGDDGTAQRGSEGSPFLTVAAALTAASAGDLIRCLPGSHTVTASILKHNVRVQIEGGATVSRASTTVDNTHGIIDDLAGAVTAEIFGDGALHATATTASRLALIAIGNADSDVEVRIPTLTHTDATTGPTNAVATALAGIRQSNGKLVVKFTDYLAPVTGQQTAFLWLGGVKSSYRGVRVDAGYYGAWQHAASATDWYLELDELNIGPVGLAFFTDGGDVSGSALWAHIKRTRLGAGGVRLALWNDGKFYLTGNKANGCFIYGSGGRGFVDLDKIEAAADGTREFPMFLDGGNLDWNVRTHDPLSFTGLALRTGAGARLFNSHYKAAGGTDHALITNGETVLHACDLDNTNAAGTDAVYGTVTMLAGRILSDIGGGAVDIVGGPNHLGGVLGSDSDAIVTAVAAIPNTVIALLSDLNPTGGTITVSVTCVAHPSVVTYGYQWKQNGSNVGTDSPTSPDLSGYAGGDAVICTVTATNDVGSASPVDSDTANFNVIAGAPTGVALANPAVPAGGDVSCNASVSTGYPVPTLHYAWTVGGFTGFPDAATLSNPGGGGIVTYVCDVTSTNTYGTSSPVTSDTGTFT